MKPNPLLRQHLFQGLTGNYFSGNRIALFFFGFLTAVTIVRSLIHIIAPDGGAQSIATIPLSSFTPNGAAAVIHLFALWGLSQLLMGLVYLLALVHRRTLIPLLYFLGILEYGFRLLLTILKPMEITGTAPGAVGNYLLVPVLIIMLILSLLPNRAELRD